MARLEIDHDELRPLIREVVREMLAILPTGLDGPLLSEAEAADRLGWPRHRLRDARLRGEVKGRRIAGKWWYFPSDLASIGRGDDDE